jgi:IMP dehydrogenase
MVATFDSLWLVPGYSEIETRHGISLKGESGLEVPLIGAPMDTVMSLTVAETLAGAGAGGVLHRYKSIRAALDEWTSLTDRARAAVWVALPSGGDLKERFAALHRAGARSFCVDVAHGHHRAVGDALEWLQGESPHLDLMGGNVADLDGFNWLADAGARLIRVGVAGGSVCETRRVTGFGLPTLESVIRCARSDRDAVIVADGGIRSSGDAVKALACGAGAIMLGGLLAGHRESPGEVISRGGRDYKVFRGMASKEAQSDWRGWVSVAEGRSVEIPLREETLAETLDGLIRGIKSGLSYAGCSELSHFSASCKKVWEEKSYEY